MNRFYISSREFGSGETAFTEDGKPDGLTVSDLRGRAWARRLVWGRAFLPSWIASCNRIPGRSRDKRYTFREVSSGGPGFLGRMFFYGNIQIEYLTAKQAFSSLFYTALRISYLRGFSALWPRFVSDKPYGASCSAIALAI